MSGAPHELLARVAAIARRAGREILEVYASGEPAARLKADASPLTAADLRAHRLIEQSLHELTPEVPVLSEEAAHTRFVQRSQWRRYWLGGPLDSTRGVLSRHGEVPGDIPPLPRRAPALGGVRGSGGGPS